MYCLHTECLYGFVQLVLTTERLVSLTEYIQVIMSMEESVQHVVMMAIQEVSLWMFFSPKISNKGKIRITVSVHGFFFVFW